jgi:5-methyltetrahydropteroyltriglutamate--homocysteine methyltransferase
MKRSENRILTTHTGSIIRSRELLDLAAAAKESDERRDRYHAFLEAAVEEVVRKQAALGIDIVNDGEYGKSSWSNYILSRITGFEVRPEQKRPVRWLGRDRERFADAVAQDLPRLAGGTVTEACTGPVRYKDHDSIERTLSNLRRAVQSARVEEAFVTVVAPASTAYDGVNEYYPTDEEYVFAIADALREEYQAVHKAGFLVQVDDAVLANMYDELVQTSPQHYRHWAELRVAALNHALEGIPEERVRYHVCFGSWHVPHISDAPLEEIVDLILRVHAGAYSIEAANPRHEHEWRVWTGGRLPQGKILIPGVITHHTVVVEHPRVVADRIIRYAQIVGRENVIAGSDCGFAQNETIQRVPPSVMWAKFEALVEGARIATKELWRN